jgi:hypothetical protein
MLNPNAPTSRSFKDLLVDVAGIFAVAQLRFPTFLQLLHSRIFLATQLEEQEVKPNAGFHYSAITGRGVDDSQESLQMLLLNAG